MFCGITHNWGPKPRALRIENIPDGNILLSNLDSQRCWVPSVSLPFGSISYVNLFYTKFN